MARHFGEKALREWGEGTLHEIEAVMQSYRQQHSQGYNVVDDEVCAVRLDALREVPTSRTARSGEPSSKRRRVRSGARYKKRSKQEKRELKEWREKNDPLGGFFSDGSGSSISDSV